MGYSDRPDRGKIASTPVETHSYGGKRYLTLDCIDQISALFEGIRKDELEENLPALLETAHRSRVFEERERILDYLEYWWRSYTEDTGYSRHTFALPKDWKEAIRRGKPPYKSEDWVRVNASTD